MLPLTLAVAVATLHPSTLRVDWVRSATTTAEICPDGAAFEQALRDRLLETTAGAVEAWVRSSESGFAATVRVRRPSTSPVEREVEAENCDRLVATAAVVAAVLLDPWADPHPIESPPEEELPLAEPTSAGPSEPRPELGRLDFVAGIEAQAGTLPVATLGPQLEGRWHPEGPWVVSLGISHLPQVREDAYGFSLTSGFLGVGARLKAGPVELGAMVRGHLGAMTAVVFPSETISPSNPGTSSWAAASLRLRTALIIADRFGVEATGGPVLAFTRQRYDVLGQVDPAFQEEAVALRLGLSLFLLFRE